MITKFLGMNISSKEIIIPECNLNSIYCIIAEYGKVYYNRKQKQV